MPRLVIAEINRSTCEISFLSVVGVEDRTVLRGRNGRRKRKEGRERWEGKGGKDSKRQTNRQ